MIAPDLSSTDELTARAEGASTSGDTPSQSDDERGHVASQLIEDLPGDSSAPVDKSRLQSLEFFMTFGSRIVSDRLGESSHSSGDRLMRKSISAAHCLRREDTGVKAMLTGIVLERSAAARMSRQQIYYLHSMKMRQASACKTNYLISEPLGLNA
mmetsp:Transcript_48536/g.76685  ORF Transcript_48536/g.76685 Transcript_48536/m.76685 type:complete len:155 (+) Transcript_48536:260-724(+)